MKIEIPLTFNRKDFEDHYFGSNNIHWFKSPLIKRQFITLAASFLGLVVMSIMTMLWGNISLLLFGGFIFIIVAIDYLMTLNNLQQYKKDIDSFINHQEKYTKSTLILSDNYFSITQDEDSSIEKWGNFNKVNISKTYIMLEGETNYFIPRNAMKEKEFEEVKKIINDKVII